MIQLRRLAIVTTLLAAAGLLVASGCGPSAAKTRRAERAIYKCDPATVFEQIVSIVKERAGSIGAADQDEGYVAGGYRWHTATGVPKPKSGGYIGDGDVAFAYLVQMVPRDPGWSVRAAARVVTHVTGSPRGKKIDRTDAAWPSWADEKIDVLLVTIYDKLSSRCPDVVDGK